MIRKPKIHPEYNIKLVGINFRERWNVVQHATKDELEAFITNFKHIKKMKVELWNTKDWWERKQSIIDERTQNIYLRKVWRKRYSEAFKQDILYRVDRNISRWNLKLGPKTGSGIATSYHFDRNRSVKLVKDEIVILTKTDELGNLYFSKISEINAPNPYVFNRDSAQLGWILPVEA